MCHNLFLFRRVTMDILVASEDPWFSEAVADVLRDEGYTATTCSLLTVAAAVAEIRPKVLIARVFVPLTGMSAQVASLVSLGVPLLLLTSRGLPGTPHLACPFDAADLSWMIEDVLTRRSA
jgi:hypothetical protein